jgi:hypothetical protein
VSPSTNPDSVHMVELEAHRRHVAIALITTVVPSFMLVGLFTSLNFGTAVGLPLRHSSSALVRPIRGA